jgi:MEDS: MEthanogen/methylotroph, DcmR Sensory domain
MFALLQVATWKRCVNMGSCDHLVEISADDHLVEHAAAFFAEGFSQDCACIAIVTPEHQQLIDLSLARRGQQPEPLLAANRYIALNAEQTLESLLLHGQLDDLHFHRMFGELVRLAGAGGRAVRIVGEMPSLLAKRGDRNGVIHLEELWNDLSRDQTFSAYCLYPAELFSTSADAAWRDSICAIHSRSLAAI